MEIPANRARIEFALEGAPYPVITPDGEECLNQGFYFQVDLQAAVGEPVDDFVGRRGLLPLTGKVSLKRNCQIEFSDELREQDACTGEPRP